MCHLRLLLTARTMRKPSRIMFSIIWKSVGLRNYIYNDPSLAKRKAHRQRIEEYDSDASSADEGDFNGVKKNNLEEEDLFAIEDHDLRPRSKKAAKENTIEDDQAEEADPTELYTAVRDVNEEDGATVQKDIPLEPFNMRAVLEEGYVLVVCREFNMN